MRILGTPITSNKYGHIGGPCAYMYTCSADQIGIPHFQTASCKHAPPDYLHTLKQSPAQEKVAEQAPATTPGDEWDAPDASSWLEPAPQASRVRAVWNLLSHMLNGPH